MGLDPDQGGCEASQEHERRVVTVNMEDKRDGAPYRIGDDWVLDRTMTLRAKCSYEVYSSGAHVRSYSLPPWNTTMRVTLCSGDSAVAPYKGPCPLK